MKTTIVHCVAAAYSSTERAFVENPPVGIVVSACATASNPLMRESAPVAPRSQRIAISTAVSATYRIQSRRAVSRMRVLRLSISGPGSSDSNSCRPPTRSRGKTASASTMIPSPPSHCVSCRQISSECESDSTSVSTVPPVVVKPAMPSK